MTLASPHKDFKLDKVPVPDTRWIGSDEMLTQLWLRLQYSNRRTTHKETPRRLVAELASLLEGDSGHFQGFTSGTGVAETWIRADLVKIPKRYSDEFTVARPVHLPATRLRNAKRESDANASAIPYQWIHELDPELGEILRAWLDVDAADIDRMGDLPTYALALLAENEEEEVIVKGERSGVAPMLCDTRGRWYTQDLRALLAYREHLPRAVLVDHVRRLTMLHIALHLIQTYRAVVEIEADPEALCGCESGEGRCTWMPSVVVDCGEDPRSEAAKLAELSWTEVELTLSSYVRAHLRLRKAMEFAQSSLNRSRKFDLDSVRGLARIRSSAPRTSFDEWSRSRVEQVLLAESGLSDTAKEYESMSLAPFDVYMSLLNFDGERRWFNYHRQVLDSAFGKNFRDGGMRQPLGGRRRRRLALSPPLIETLVLTAMVHFDANGRPMTRPLRVDQLVDILAARYGFLVAQPPDALVEDPSATRAMLMNNLTLRTRLRQAGLFVDQSDAFLTQTIRPRVRFS
jgi:hypothetical protein